MPGSLSDAKSDLPMEQIVWRGGHFLLLEVFKLIDLQYLMGLIPGQVHRIAIQSAPSCISSRLYFPDILKT